MQCYFRDDKLTFNFLPAIELNKFEPEWNMEFNRWLSIYWLSFQFRVVWNKRC